MVLGLWGIGGLAFAWHPCHHMYADCVVIQQSDNDPCIWYGTAKVPATWSWPDFQCVPNGSAADEVCISAFGNNGCTAEAGCTALASFEYSHQCTP